MAKRYQVPRDFARSFKKPKLDISINKGRPVQKSRSADVPRTSYSPNKDFWDDGDDDVLLLATQVAETAVNNRRSDCSFALTETELTFTEFVPNVATSSTQRPLQEVIVPNPEILSQLFEDDFDWDMKDDKKSTEKRKSSETLAANSDESHFKKPKSPTPVPSNKSNEKSDSQLFKKPSDVNSFKNKSQVNTNIANQSITIPSTDTEPEVLSQSAARRQLAAERQIKFLMDRLDNFKKENQKLSVELDENKAKMSSKEGEISLLRDELKHTKQQMQNLKMERILTADAAKSECRSKIAQLSTQVEAKKTEAQLKALECIQLKMRRAEETQRFEMSMRNESMFVDDHHPPPAADIGKKLPQNKYAQRELMRVRGEGFKSDSYLDNELSSGDDFFRSKHSHFLYNEIKDDFGFKGISDQVIANQWQILRIAAVNLQAAAEKQGLTDLEEEEYSKNILGAITWVLHELHNLSENLTVTNCRVYPLHNYDIQNDLSEEHHISLLQPTPLYPSESAINLRRCIAAMAVLCRYDFIARQIFTKVTESCSIEGEYILLAAAKRLCRIGFSNEVVEHFGLVETFASLAHSLFLYAVRVQETDPLSNDQQSQIVHLLKEVIFTRPSPWIMKEITFCVLLCTQLPYGLSLLCQNSAGACFRAEPVRSICEFTKDSCFLQVHASLLEVCFPLYTPLRPIHFDLLTVICLNHLRFVYFCFTKPPKFIHNHLPSYDEDDDDIEPPDEQTSNENSANMYNSSNTATSNNSSSSNTLSSSVQQQQQKGGGRNCECYHRLALSIVALGYQVLKHWLQLKRTTSTNRLGEIARVLVQLLYIIFCDNYLTTLFRDAEDTTKHYLHLTCQWIAENIEILQLEQFHLKFLEKLQNSHVMPKHLKEEENLANLTADLEDWCRITNDDINKNQKTFQNNNVLLSAFEMDNFFEGLKGYAYNFQ